MQMAPGLGEPACTHLVVACADPAGSDGTPINIRWHTHKAAGGGESALLKQQNTLDPEKEVNFKVQGKQTNFLNF